MGDTRGRSWLQGLSWNVAALGVAGVSALAANAFIAGSFGPVGLGIFSQTMTWFALVAQLAALGIHYAVLRAAATAPDDAAARRAVQVGLGAVLVVSTVVAAASYAVAPLVARVLDSEPMLGSVRYASLALVAHAVAKVAGAGLNGLHRMRAFSGVQAARGVGLLAAATGLGLAGAPLEVLGVVFVVSELLAASVAVAAWRGLRPAFSPSAARDLVAYGARATGAAVTVEANSRVDIGILGLLATDRVVGVYALAATAFEGVLQLFVVLRNQVNATVSGAIGRGEPEAVDDLHRQLRPWTLAAAVGVLVVAVVAFGPTVRVLGLSPDFLAALPALAILLAGLVAAAQWLPFDQLLVVGGRPGAQSRAVAWSLVVNVAVNLALVPLLGGVGAAIGTALALTVLALGVAVRGGRMLGTRLGLPGWATGPERHLQ